MHRRETITELGPDTGAAKPHKRHEILFDLGLGLKSVDFCVRTGDPDLIQLIRAELGRPLLHTPRLYDQLSLHSPDRIATSKVARIEVEQRIPKPHESSPLGPHTHLLPRLLGRRHVHSAILKIPDGWLPCLFAYPANPLSDRKGKHRPFDIDAHARFQSLLRTWGPPELLAAKAHVLRALRDEEKPTKEIALKPRHERLAMRVALRQACAEGRRSITLEQWQRLLEPSN